MDKPTVISACLFLAADIFAIASVANPDWINTGDKNGKTLNSLQISVKTSEQQLTVSPHHDTTTPVLH